MRDGWRKKYALEYEVKSGEKANRLPARNLPLPTEHSPFARSSREWIRKFLAEKSCFDLSTPQSPRITALIDTWMFSYAYKATLCRATSPSLSLPLVCLSLSLFFQSPTSAPSFFHILLRRFYPEAELGSCYKFNKHSSLSLVTAAFARICTGNFHVFLPSFSLILSFLLFVPRQSSHSIFFFSIE